MSSTDKDAEDAGTEIVHEEKRKFQNIATVLIVILLTLLIAEAL